MGAYKFPKMTLEEIQALPESHRNEVLRVVIKTFNLANEKLGFKVAEDALYVNEADTPQAVREIRSIEEADAILNALANATLVERPVLQVVPEPEPEPRIAQRNAPIPEPTSSRRKPCHELIRERLSQGEANINQIIAYILQAQPETKVNSVHDSLWRMVRDGRVSKGHGKRPYYRLNS